MLELTDIFARDPLELTKDAPEIEEVIKAFREMRWKFNLGDTKAGSVKPKASAKAKSIPGLDLDDDELGLKI